MVCSSYTSEFYEINQNFNGNTQTFQYSKLWGNQNISISYFTGHQQKEYKANRL